VLDFYLSIYLTSLEDFVVGDIIICPYKNQVYWNPCGGGSTMAACFAVNFTHPILETVVKVSIPLLLFAQVSSGMNHPPRTTNACALNPGLVGCRMPQDLANAS
jgi:hypothetical protein